VVSWKAKETTRMSLFRKSLATELTGRAERLAGAITHDRSRELTGTARQYAGHAGVVASRAGSRASKAVAQWGDQASTVAARAGKRASKAAATASKQVRTHPRTSIAVGAGLGIAALTAAWLLRRQQLKQRAHDHDEHDPTRYRASNDSGDALDGSGEDNPIPGESGLY
jgi:hypothetical protein